MQRGRLAVEALLQRLELCVDVPVDGTLRLQHALGALELAHLLENLDLQVLRLVPQRGHRLEVVRVGLFEKVQLGRHLGAALDQRQGALEVGRVDARVARVQPHLVLEQVV